jgi:hypothetical protein
MKKLVVLVLTTFFSACAFSQDTTRSGATKTIMQHDSLQDCVKMENGTMMIRKDGKWSQMVKDMVLRNGLTISTDGTFQEADGTTSKLQEGEAFDMDGERVFNR